MKTNLKHLLLRTNRTFWILLASGLALLPLPGHAGELITFETLPPGPSRFVDAGAEQTFTLGGVTFSGGVILGNPTSFPADSFATPPNLYATASSVAGGDPTLQSTLTLTLDPTLAATTVQGALFNGFHAASYTIDGYSGSTLVDTESIPLQANGDSGSNGVFSLASVLPITSVTITPSDTTEFDFLIDTIAISEPIPEPGSCALAGVGLVLLFLMRRKIAGALS